MTVSKFGRLHLSLTIKRNKKNKGLIAKKFSSSTKNVEGMKKAKKDGLQVSSMPFNIHNYINFKSYQSQCQCSFIFHNYSKICCWIMIFLWGDI